MIDVAMTRAELSGCDVAVVIDVLRATSTATQALASGYRRVTFAETVDRARSLSGPGRVLAGEQGCVMPPGFDQGNSPQDARVVRGEELVLATTNGAPTVIAAAQAAPRVLIGCLLNLDAVARAVCELLGAGAERVQIVCAGTDGRVALEDAYAAGRLSSRLPGERSDGARVAEAVAAAYADPCEALGLSLDAQVLREVGSASDIGFCAADARLAVLPILDSWGDGIATVVAAPGLSGATRAGAVERVAAA